MEADDIFASAISAVVGQSRNTPAFLSIGRLEQAAGPFSAALPVPPGEPTGLAPMAQEKSLVLPIVKLIRNRRFRYGVIALSLACSLHLLLHLS